MNTAPHVAARAAIETFDTTIAHRTARAAGRAAAFGLCVLIGGCASHAPLRSGQATSYEGLPVDDGKSRILAKPLAPECIGGYAAVRFEPLAYAEGVRESVRPKTREIVERAVMDGTRAAFAETFAVSSETTTNALRARLTVTRITESSPLGNVIASAILNPIFNGALAIEAEFLDASSGRQCGLYVWADEGSVINFKEFTGNFRRAGHPQKLASYFAESLAQYIEPLNAAARPPSPPTLTEPESGKP